MNLCNAVVHNAPEDIMVVGSKRDHQSDRIVFYRLGWEKKWKGWTIFYFKRPLLTSPIQSSWSGISLRSVVCITIHNLMSSTLDFKQLDRPPSLPQTPPLTSELVLLETIKNSNLFLPVHYKHDWLLDISFFCVSCLDKRLTRKSVCRVLVHALSENIVTLRRAHHVPCQSFRHHKFQQTLYTKLMGCLKVLCVM